MTDGELIDAIATQRSQEAFAALYREYESAAYNLAYSVTGNRTTAEEAVQNALLRIWQSASSFKPGNARGWILCIVAREALKLIKRQRREQHIQMEAKERQPVVVKEDHERSELLAALRGAMQKLPELDRQLVTLYFVGGLTHDEISEEIDTPRQTVSRHIAQALESMRGELKRLGFAASLPLLNAEGLSEAACTGRLVPEGLSQKVMLVMKSAPAAKAGAIATTSYAGWGIAGLFAIAVLTGAAMWPKAPAKTVVVPLPLPPPPLPLPPPQQQQQPAPVAVAEVTPQWQPMTDEFHDVLGQAMGTWDVAKATDGLTVAFKPAPGQEGKHQSYCYLGKNFTESTEFKGEIEYLGGGTDWGAVILVCHANRVNCIGYNTFFKKANSPLKFRFQIRFEQKGVRLALSLVDAAGKVITTPDREDWIPPPWKPEKQPPVVNSWDPLSLALMRECGFGVEFNDAVRVTKLQSRKLVDSEWNRAP